MNRHIQGVLNKIISRLHIRNSGGQKTGGPYIQNAKRQKNVNQDNYIQQNCPAKVREKLRHSQVNKS